MKDTPIEQMNKIKLLGFTIDGQLTWSDHIDTIVIKMGQGIAVARRCSQYITPLIRKEVTQALVPSHLEHCMVVWSSAAKRDLKKLQVAQNRAARFGLSCSYRANVARMHHSLE